MQIISYDQRAQHQYSNREMAELEVFDILTELLSITFEKYDMEVIIDSDSSLYNSESVQSISGSMHTEIDFEDIVETQNTLEITLSGKVKGLLNYEETFMLLFSLHRNHEVNPPPWKWASDYGTSSGANSLYLRHSRKAEQFSDPIFSMNWISENSNGNRQDLGQGKGILIFSRDQGMLVN